MLALIRAAGGAVLASLAVEIMPDAYEGGDPEVAFATAAGLVLTFVLVWSSGRGRRPRFDLQPKDYGRCGETSTPP